MTRKTLKFDPRWNGRLPRTGLHTGTRFSIRSDLNETEYTTLIYRACLNTSIEYWMEYVQSSSGKDI